jgi:hypothetical protein
MSLFVEIGKVSLTRRFKSQTKKFEVLNTTFTIDKSYSFNASIKSNSNEASNSSDSSHASDSINPIYQIQMVKKMKGFKQIQ